MPTFNADCNRCGAQKATFEVYWLNAIAKDLRGVTTFDLSGSCRSCGRSNTMSVRHGSYAAIHNTHDLRSIMNSVANLNDILILNAFLNVSDLYVPDVPDFVEGDLRQIYKEGRLSLVVGNYNAAASMFRLCVDLLTRPLLPDTGDAAKPQPSGKERKDVAPRLRWLLSNRILDQGLADLADCIREDGNDASHHGDVRTREEAEDVADFCRILLERLVTEPKRMEVARERREERRDRR